MTRTHRRGVTTRRLLIGVASMAVASAGLLVPVHSASADAHPWMNQDQPPEERANDLLKEMTLEEKVHMLHGVEQLESPIPTVGYLPPIPRLKVPGITMTDGPAGVRDSNSVDNQDRATALPSPSALAASFDTELAEEHGSVLGSEARALGQAQVFAPGHNIQRVPANGRNFEYYSEDPYLSGTLAGASTRGIQGQGVIATLKHYAANNQETDRMTGSSEIDDRTLHEIYEKNFDVAIADGKPGSVMCSYNKINSVHACENNETLGDLRSKLGFDGYVVSDYPATHSTRSVKAGLNVELPTGVHATLPKVQSALNDGSITMHDVDTRVRETLTTLFRFGMFDRDPMARGQIDEGKDSAAARRIAAESAVLMKNDDAALPLSSSTDSIAVIGGPAKQTAIGGGSSAVKPLSMDNAYDAIAGRAGSSTKVSYADGADRRKAAEEAKNAETAVVFVKDEAKEGEDRKNLSLPGNQDALVNAVAEANPNTVVVLQTGAPVLMPWLPKVKSVLQTWYPGARGGAATAQLLWGDVNPGGKLPQTWPKADEQTPVSTQEQFPGVDGKSRYTEGVYVGYRWYDKENQAPLFPFGHGLSYTAGFSYQDLKLEKPSGGPDDPVTVSFKLTNAGERAGAEVPQLYVGKPDTKAQPPPKELGAFTKVHLERGETKTVTLKVDPRELSYWDSEAKDYRVQSGEYGISIGGSSRWLPLHGTYHVK
ncbi:beta-glucosidase family protein [Streptomyces sp. 3N207]|uniref:beta-glucosidase family protein n=1 Tax=Streptomyces sp. 3N207 TaxID=3457417 RepID=UPI003FD113AA